MDLYREIYFGEAKDEPDLTETEQSCLNGPTVD